MNLLKNVLLSTIAVVISAIAGIILVEIGGQLLKYHKLSFTNQRFMFLSASGDGTIFNNIKTFFLHEPKTRIHVVTYYFLNGAWVTEYDYYFNTNNLGLVQSVDIDLNKESILLLGDSFTQGVGAPPWTDELSKKISANNYQIVNGGVLATGFAQWLLLSQYLSEKGVNIRKLAVIFISDDYIRLVDNIGEHELSCLKNSKACAGVERFLPLPKDNNLSKLLPEYYNARLKKEANRKPIYAKYIPTISGVIDGLMPDPYTTAPHIMEMQINGNAIDKFISTYNDNVIFIHIPQKDELRDGMWRFGLEARNRILAKGGHVFDGFKQCGLTIQDYYEHDGHPNQKGYEKISKCVYMAIYERHWVE